MAGLEGVPTERQPLPRLDPASREWLDHLRVGHPGRDAAIGRLHDVFRRVAFAELGRRSARLYWIVGPEFDDLAHQAADDALVSLLGKLDEFRGLSRFTTWAYKFVVVEVSAKVARHPWRRQRPDADGTTLERLADPGLLQTERLLQREQLDALREAIGGLTSRQRQVFVAIALNHVPIDVVALELSTNRNAIYKNLFDARRSLRSALAAAGHPVDHDYGLVAEASG